MPERDTDLFQISIRQIGEHREINVVLGKALSVLPDTELWSQSATCCIAAAPRGFQATWYALETARPSSRRLTNLKWYSLPEGLFGGHGDAAFKKIPGICSAPIDGNYRLEANLVIALPTQITPGLIVPVVTKLSPRLFSQQDLDQRAADASNKQGLVRAARKPISTA